MKLSVNLNKIALLRNARGENYPDLNYFANKAIDLGVDGLTLHPRPDHRHATSKDVINLAKLSKERHVEFFPWVLAISMFLIDFFAEPDIVNFVLFSSLLFDQSF